MKLYYPIKPNTVTQKFGKNENTYYAEAGLKGHTAQDLFCDYGQNIHSSCDGEVYSILNKDNPDLMRYRAVYVLFDDGTDAYEISYGHATDILVKKGDKVKTGTLLMTGGNTGDVASMGKKVTAEEKNKGSTAGTHLHWQLRPLKKTKDYVLGNLYLYDGTGFVVRDGYYYEYIDYNNGYWGCIDPEPFIVREYAEDMALQAPKFDFKRTLVYGMRNDTDVKKLQYMLKKEGFMSENIPSTGNYLNETAKAVLKWQQFHQIASPIELTVLNGKSFGPKSRSKVLEIYNK